MSFINKSCKRGEEGGQSRDDIRGRPLSPSTAELIDRSPPSPSPDAQSADTEQRFSFQGRTSQKNYGKEELWTWTGGVVRSHILCMYRDVTTVVGGGDRHFDGRLDGRCWPGDAPGTESAESAPSPSSVPIRSPSKFTENQKKSLFAFVSFVHTPNYRRS